MLDFDSPVLFAIEARDQCVASAGVCSNVAVITSSTWSNRIDGGRPGRGSSTSPSNRLATNRARHLFTVFADTRSSAATCLFDAPGAAHANTILDRNANACADLARRDQRSSCARSPSDNVNSAFGRPVLAIHQFYDFNNGLTAHDTSPGHSSR